MGEFQKKWFQIVWMLLLFASLVVDSIPRMSDALWAHSEAIAVLDKILTWTILPMTILLIVLHNIESWHKGERYFWRHWQKGAAVVAVGGGLGFLLVIIVKWCKGDAPNIDNGTRMIILGVFALIGLVWAFARYKFRNWQSKE